MRMHSTHSMIVLEGLLPTTPRPPPTKRRYVPGTAPHDFYDNYYTSKPKVKLYVRRVFISDDFEDLLPRWGAGGGVQVVLGSP